MLCKKRGSRGLLVRVTYLAVIFFSLFNFVQMFAVENNQQEVDVDENVVRKQKGKDVFMTLKSYLRRFLTKNRFENCSCDDVLIK